LKNEGIKKAIAEQARRLGFTLAGFTTPDPPTHFLAFEDWLQAGHHGNMLYLSSDKAVARRSNPLLILPKCKSILSLAIPYRNPDFPVSSPRNKSGNARSHPHTSYGQVAAYAWGEDYHNVLVRKLTALVHSIEVQVGHKVSNRYYTDTGPILERDLAQRAGLGWIGKNTCLINPKSGSYLFLAEIFLDLEIEPDLPFVADHCGTCTRCIDACPTGCILPNRSLDARRCISYLTIENKVEIPEALRPMLGNWVFGCDICQMVCPWNRFSPSEIDASFSPQAGIQTPELILELGLTSQVFNRVYGESPVKRAKRRGYLRNVAVALGNSLEPRAIPALEKAAEDPELLIRKHASWALERILANRNE
jgi:epoxyqueuosine reductase